MPPLHHVCEGFPSDNFFVADLRQRSFQQALPSLISTKAVGNTALVEEHSSQPGHKILMGDLGTSPSSGAALLGSRANYGGAAPVFALDFSEKTTCTTTDTKLGGDMVRNIDSEGVKLCLEAEVGFVEGPRVSGFKVILTSNCCMDDDYENFQLPVCSNLCVNISE